MGEVSIGEGLLAGFLSGAEQYGKRQDELAKIGRAQETAKAKTMMDLYAGGRGVLPVAEGADPLEGDIALPEVLQKRIGAKKVRRVAQRKPSLGKEDLGAAPAGYQWAGTPQWEAASGDFVTKWDLKPVPGYAARATAGKKDVRKIAIDTLKKEFGFKWDYRLSDTVRENLIVAEMMRIQNKQLTRGELEPKTTPTKEGKIKVRRLSDDEVGMIDKAEYERNKKKYKLEK